MRTFGLDTLHCPLCGGELAAPTALSKLTRVVDSGIMKRTSRVESAWRAAWPSYCSSFRGVLIPGEARWTAIAR